MRVPIRECSDGTWIAYVSGGSRCFEYTGHVPQTTLISGARYPCLEVPRVRITARVLYARTHTTGRHTVRQTLSCHLQVRELERGQRTQLILLPTRLLCESFILTQASFRHTWLSCKHHDFPTPLQVLPTRREAAATAGGSRARSMQARAAGSEGELDLLSALGLTAGEGASAVADLLADPTFDSTRACPAPLPVSRRHAGGRRPAKQRPGRPRGEGFHHASPRSPHAQALPRCTSQWIPEAQLSPRWSSIANACRRRLLQKNKWAPLLGLKAGPTAG